MKEGVGPLQKMRWYVAPELARINAAEFQSRIGVGCTDLNHSWHARRKRQDNNVLSADGSQTKVLRSIQKYSQHICISLSEQIGYSWQLLSEEDKSP